MKTAYEVVSILRPRDQKPVRDPEYRRYVRSHPCAACGKSWSVEACHTGPHGLGQKACDLTCIPLCRVQHQEFDCAPREFAERHGVNVAEVIFVLRSRYVHKAVA